MNLEKVTVMIVIIAVVFTVTLTQSLQTAEGLAASGDKMIYQLYPGESKMLTWLVINDEDKPLDVEFYATGPGSELLIFEEYLTMDPKSRERYEIFVSVPEGHETDVEYRPLLYVLTRGEKIEGAAAGIVINMQMQTNPIIKIGDNPIFTSQVVVKEIEEDKEETPIQIIPEAKTVEEKEIVETLEEKLERIKAANEKTATPESIPVDTPQVEKTTTTKSEYIKEPTIDTAPVVKPVVVEEEGGGCLIATAAFGSEMAPQVQLLREIRDNQLMNSNSGMAFMSAFNQFYYSFSPYIADVERDSPIFKETVKLTLTPMLSTLSVMEHADSESKVLGLGIGVILMNLGMYVALPTFGIVKLIQFKKNR